MLNHMYSLFDQLIERREECLVLNNNGDEIIYIVQANSNNNQDGNGNESGKGNGDDEGR